MLGDDWASCLGNHSVYFSSIRRGSRAMWNFLGWAVVYSLYKIRRDGDPPLHPSDVPEMSDKTFGILSLICNLAGWSFLGWLLWCMIG